MFSFFRKKKKDSETPSPSSEQITEIIQEQETKEIIPTPAPDHDTEVAGLTDHQDAAVTKHISATGVFTENNTDTNSNINTDELEDKPEDHLDTEENHVDSIKPLENAKVTDHHIPDQEDYEEQTTATPSRQSWMQRLSSGLKRTGQNITDVFTGGTQIDDHLYEELETALLMADAGVAATQYLLEDVKRRVKDTRAKDPAQVRALLAQSLEELLKPLEASLVIGEHTPTVIMVAGVNGAGKTTSIGKLTRYLANANYKVLLAAGDTFRAAAREQLEVWADRNQVEIIAQEGGDPASVSFDAVSSGKAKKTDVVVIDTAGRLATQPHLMEELKKIRRVIGKAMPEAPHEVLLVVDGNTGQNALAQVKAFDEAIQLTGLIVTKLDGTAKGGVMAAIALWSQERGKTGKPAVPIYFIGVGEQVEDLQTFNANEFTKALLQL